MPARLSKTALLDRIMEAVYASGWNLIFEGAPSHHPFQLRIFKADKSIAATVYIWSLTHGGGVARPQDEYRIQMTHVDFPLLLSSSYKTLLLGWHEELRIFAGFDVLKHLLSRSRSPSIQIRLNTLKKAQKNRFSFQRKGNDEIAVAFPMPLFVDYVLCQEDLHQSAGNAKEVKALEIATSEGNVPEDLLQILPAERQIVVRTVATRFRSSTFRNRVLSAYEHFCAACEIQLDLLEAAHIIPVESPESNDHTSNGLALCHIHHEAYDRGLLRIDERFRISLNDKKINRLKQDHKLSGLDRLVEDLRQEIRLPSNTAHYPRPEYLKRGMELRLTV